MPKCSYVLAICTYDSLQIANFEPKSILVVIHLVKEHVDAKSIACRGVDSLRTEFEGFHIASLVYDSSICINFNLVVLSHNSLQVVVGTSWFQEADSRSKNTPKNSPNTCLPCGQSQKLPAATLESLEISSHQGHFLCRIFPHVLQMRNPAYLSHLGYGNATHFRQTWAVSGKIPILGDMNTMANQFCLIADKHR